jgi:hypothetical protein
MAIAAILSTDTVKRAGYLPLVLLAFFAVNTVINAVQGQENAGAGYAIAGMAGSHPTQVYWGDAHVHTSNSIDAGLYHFLVGPEEAFRFARGEQVQSNEGTLVKLIRPLDFLMVADHAEYIGLWNRLRVDDPLILETAVGQRWYDTFRDEGSVGESGPWIRGVEVFKSENFMRSVWQRHCEVADRMNKPGKFTALIGFEWTSTPNGNNLHRNVVFKDDAAQATRVLPFSQFDSQDPEDLWAYMADYEEKTGGNVLAIPHNANFSNGLMFAMETYTGKLLTRSYVETRSRWEPLLEITQIKGDSETHPLLSPNDEFADFRTWDRGNMFAKSNQRGKGTQKTLKGKAPAPKKDAPKGNRKAPKGSKKAPKGPKTASKGSGGFGPYKQPSMLPHEYARSALKLGLDLEAKLGVNPFKFGVIGGTDSHTGLVTIRQDSPVGKRSVIEEKVKGYVPPKCPLLTQKGPVSAKGKNPVSAKGKNPVSAKGKGRIDGRIDLWQWEQVSGGLAGVWATENTRKGLFEAMERKETYGTTGPRIVLRFFGGWDYDADDLGQADLAKVGYTKGVPMGGDLARAPKGTAPHFLIRAVKDPDGANLDRIQVVKGWRDKKGKLHERVFNVAMSDGRKTDAAGEVRPVGNTVDTESATYTNSIGDPELAIVWTDPDFTRDEPAFYYVRVLEIPTPRWTDFDSLGYELTEGLPMTIQERAYSSPIWYSPE